MKRAMNKFDVDSCTTLLFNFLTSCDTLLQFCYSIIIIEVIFLITIVCSEELSYATCKTIG